MKVEQVGRALLSLRIWIFALLLLAISLFRSGVHWPDFPGPGEPYWLNAESWPAGNSWASSWSWLLVPRLLGISTAVSWALLYVVVAALALTGIGFIVSRLPNRGAKALILIALCSSPILPRMLNDPLGYDRITLLGAIIIVASRSWWGIVLGAIVFSSGNSEVAIVGSICALLLSLAPVFKTIRQKAVITFFVAVVTSAGISLLKSLSTLAGDSRWSELGSHAIESFKLHSPGLPLLLFSFYAGAWIFAFWLIDLCNRNWELILVVTSLVVIPGLVSLFTLDGTRVFVVTAALPFLLAVVCLAQHQQSTRHDSGGGGVRSGRSASWRQLVGLSFLFLVFTPSIFIGPYEYDSLAPFQYVIGHL